MRAVTPRMLLRWIDYAMTGAIRTNLLDDARSALYRAGLALDGRGAEALGIPEAAEALARATDDRDRIYVLREAVLARATGAWWDVPVTEVTRWVAGAGVGSGPRHGPISTDAWDFAFRSHAPYFDAMLENPRSFTPPGWAVDTASSSLPGFSGVYGVRVKCSDGPVWWVAPPELRNIRHAAAAVGRRDGSGRMTMSRALLMDEERRAAVRHAFAVGGMPAGVEALAACLG